MRSDIKKGIEGAPKRALMYGMVLLKKKLKDH